jgi:hypothetical protein
MWSLGSVYPPIRRPLKGLNTSAIPVSRPDHARLMGLWASEEQEGATVNSAMSLLEQPYMRSRGAIVSALFDKRYGVDTADFPALGPDPLDADHIA